MACSRVQQVCSCSVVVLLIGLILLIVGAALLGQHRADDKPNDNSNLLLQRFRLVPGSVAYNEWYKGATNHSHTQKFFFFNVTNSDDVIKKNAKPVVKEIGPYSYRVLISRSIQISGQQQQQQQQLRYQDTKKFVFDPQTSNGSDTDIITTINIPVVSLAAWLRYNNHTELTGAVNMELTKIQGVGLFTNVAVRDLLWGYNDNSSAAVNVILKTLFDVHLYKNDSVTFGLQYQAGAGKQTTINEYTISTGETDLQDVGNTTAWNGHSNLEYWTSTTSRKLYGTDGNRFAPGFNIKSHDTVTSDVMASSSYMMSLNDMVSSDALTTSDAMKSSDATKSAARLHVFSADWCRVVYYDKQANQSADHAHLQNITTIEYVLPPSVLANGTENKGYCTPHGDCLDIGVLNVTTCKGGYPMILSQPHFYEAAEHYKTAVQGLTPLNVAHRSYIHLEPKTGEVVESSRKLQFNVEIYNSPAFQPTRKLDNGFIFPIAWTVEDYTMTSGELQQLQQDVNFVDNYTKNGTSPTTPLPTYHTEYSLIGVGACLMAMAIVLIIIVIVAKKCGTANRSEEEEERKNERRPLLDEGDH